MSKASKGEAELFLGAGASIPWPKTKSGQFLKRYFTPFLEDGATPWITNAEATLGVAVAGDVALPFSVSLKSPPTQSPASYVVSPTSHYVRYSAEEIHKIDSPAQRSLLRAAVSPLSAFCEYGRLDEVVYVNNWLLSTNLYPDMEWHQLVAILEALRRAYPTLPIVFRSIDLATRGELHGWLKGLGARMVFSRRVNIVHAGDAEVARKPDVKKDRKLLKKTGYTLLESGDLKPEHFPRIEELYNLLYLEKYSALNPAFTARFLQRMHDDKVWRFAAFEKNGRIDSVTATFSIDGVMTSPLVGYDTSLPRKLGLYRLAYMIALEHGLEAGDVINSSAGVAHFKTRRGTRPYREYNAVFDAHVSTRRRRPWKLIQAIVDGAAAPLIEHYDL